MPCPSQSHCLAFSLLLPVKFIPFYWRRIIFQTFGTWKSPMKNWCLHATLAVSSLVFAAPETASVVVFVWSGTQTQFAPAEIKARAESLSFYHPGLIHGRDHGYHNSPKRVLLLIGGAQLAGCLGGQASPSLVWDKSIQSQCAKHH